MLALLIAATSTLMTYQSASQPETIADMPSLAACVVKHNPFGARAYGNFQYEGSERSAKLRRMLLNAMIFPPCTTTGTLEIEHKKLQALISNEFKAQQVSR